MNFSIIADYSIDLMAAMEQVYAQLGFKDINDDKLKQVLEGRQNWGLGYVGLPTIVNGNRYGGHIPGLYSDTTESLWHKVTFLNQCLYPYYRSDGKMKEQPIIRLRIADFYDVVGYIDGLNFNLSDFDNMIDLNPSAIGNIPFAVKVTLNLTVIHTSEPSSNYFGFFHRKEFDNGTADPITGAYLSKDGRGITAQGVTKNSPLSFNSKERNERSTDSPKYLQERDGFRNDLELFRGSFSDFKGIGTIVPDAVRKNKFLRAMMAYVRISEVADMLGGYYGISGNSRSNRLPGGLEEYERNSKGGRTNDNRRGIVDGIEEDTELGNQNFDDLYGNTGGNRNKSPKPGRNGGDFLADLGGKSPRKPSTSPKTMGDIFSNNINKDKGGV